MPKLIDLYQTMLDQDEMWYVTADGCAFLIYDLPIWDC